MCRYSMLSVLQSHLNYAHFIIGAEPKTPFSFTDHQGVINLTPVHHDPDV